MDDRIKVTPQNTRHILAKNLTKSVKDFEFSLFGLPYLTDKPPKISCGDGGTAVDGHLVKV